MAKKINITTKIEYEIKQLQTPLALIGYAVTITNSELCTSLVI